MREKMRFSTLIWKIAFAVCGAMLSLCLAFAENEGLSFLSAMLSLLIMVWLAWKQDFPQCVFRRLNTVSGILSALLAWCFVLVYYSPPESRCARMTEVLTGVWGDSALVAYGANLLFYALLVMQAFSAFVFIAWFYHWLSDLVKDVFAESDRVEKRYMIIGGAVVCALIFVLYSLTNAFYGPVGSTGEYQCFDVLFSSDSGAFTRNGEHVFLTAWENDIRNPLFGLFALPFGLMATLFSKLFFFIPYAYPLALSFQHTLLLLFSALMTARMMALQGRIKLLFLLLFGLSFPVLFNMLAVEQYTISVFWMLALSYSFISGREGRNLCFCASAGTTIVSGALFPLVSARGRLGLKRRIRDYLSAGVCLLSCVIVSGRLGFLVRKAAEQLIKWVSEGNGEPMLSRLIQFVNYAYTCFFMPSYRINTDTIGFERFDFAPVDTLSPLVLGAGFVILVLVVLGFVLNRRSPFARICFGWFLVSVLVLVAGGWGALWNCVPLYSVYFSWAFVPLAFLALCSLFPKRERWLAAVLTAALIVMIVVNVAGFVRMIGFAVQYYPVC